MYPVTELFKGKIKENNRMFKCKIQIQHSQGMLDLSDKDLILGSLSYSEGSQAGEEFTIGGTVASDLSFIIKNKPEYADIDFEGATVIPQVALLLSVGLDTENYFLAAPHPSEFEEGEGQELWEWVPLGVFNIDDPVKLRNTTQIKAIDNMIKFDKPYSLSLLSYPATLYQIYVNACNVCDVNVGTLDFPNKDHIVLERPEGEYTFRDIIGYVAELAGCFVKCNRIGAAEIRWYEETGLTLGPGNRFKFLPKDYQVKIKGIIATVEDAIYLTGTDDYAIDLSDNPLLQGGYETVLPNILNHVKDTVFTPFDSSWQGNPAIMAGDIIKQVDRDGNEYNTLVTNSTYKYRGASALSAKGLPEKARGFKGSTNKKIAQVKRKIEKEIGDKLKTLEQAQLNAMELMGNMLGGHLIEDKINGIIYIADNPDITLATKLWKWGTGGFGYSEDGGVTWKTAITADGSIVAMLIAANIITADMVHTGILQSEDGSSWINLNNGEFNFKNVLKWEDNQLKISSPDMPEPFDPTDLENQIGNLESSINELSDDGKLTLAEANSLKIVLEDLGAGVSALINIGMGLGLTTEVNALIGNMEYLYSRLKQWIDLDEYPVDITETQRAGILNDIKTIQTSKLNLITAIDEKRDDNLGERVDDIEDLSTDISGGITTVTSNGIKVTHGATNQYSEMRADGLIRKWPYGEAKYLNDIYITEHIAPSTHLWEIPETITIELPESFRDRTGTELYVTPTRLNMDIGFGSRMGGGRLDHITSVLQTCLEIVGSNFTLSKPEIYVKNYMRQDWIDFVEQNYETDYRWISFMLVAIGK